MVNVAADVLFGPLLAVEARGGRGPHDGLRRSARAHLRAGEVGALVRLRGTDLEIGVIDREVGSPFTNADLIRRMADHIASNALAGASMAWYSGRSR